VIEHHQIGETMWIDVVDPTDEELAGLATERHLARRTFDEAHRRAARPTMHRFNDHTYVVAFSGSLAEIDMYLGDHWFITIRRHDTEGREWQPAGAIERGRRASKPHQMTPGMMLALVLDDLVDGYFDTADVLEDRLEEIEDRIFADDGDGQVQLRNERGVQQELFEVRRELLLLRRAVSPLREVLLQILRSEVRQIDGEALVVCRDTFDKLLRAIDIVDELRELVGNAVEAHLAVTSNQMNMVMKQLTAWGSIVFGATLIAGIYGMNFAHMPELDWKLGYPFALGMMLTMSVVLWRWFKHRDWL
jgi:magnesium transporter